MFSQYNYCLHMHIKSENSWNCLWKRKWIHGVWNNVKNAITILRQNQRFSVKSTFLRKKLLKSWFHEIFSDWEKKSLLHRFHGKFVKMDLMKRLVITENSWNWLIKVSFHRFHGKFEKLVLQKIVFTESCANWRKKLSKVHGFHEKLDGTWIFLLRIAC